MDKKCISTNILLDNILYEFQNFHQVEAIAIGGSTSAQTSDDTSDIDVYVFVEKDIPAFSH